ncbi:MAG: O-antigen ligase family protein, partial [Methyloceanibacter sp.]|uniref:O-antigen ligase family protein n=1 Tax=Methyloceanibacter sp. TaxID=1965321 RepID=UPI003D6C832B
DETRILAKSALAGLLVGVTFLLIELALDEPIKRFVTNNIVVLFDLGPKNVRIVDGELAGLPAFILNRNVTSLVLLLIPGLLFASALAERVKRHVVLAGLLLGATACVLISESGTSVMAFFVGAAVLALAALSLKAARVLLMAGWTAAILLAVPLAGLPYELGWNRWTFLPPDSVAARFYIWKNFADEVAKHPVGGTGIRGARALDVRLPADLGSLGEPAPKADGRRVPHPHNVFLQIWLELGAIGAFLALGVGLAALWQMRKLPRLLEIAASGLFAVCAAVAASGFDLWQTWLLTSYAFTWAALLLAAGLPALAPEAAKSPRSGASGNPPLRVTRPC